MAFLSDLETERHNSPRTRTARLGAIKSFLRFIAYRVPALLEHRRRILAIPAKTTALRRIPSLSGEEMQSPLHAPDLRRRDGIRDRAMGPLCFAAGRRVSELVRLLLRALKFPPTPNVRIVGQGRQERPLPLWKEAARDVRAWLAVRGAPRTPELFVNARGLPMTRFGFESILRKHVQTAPPACRSLPHQHVSPPGWRHTSAMLVLQATGDSRKGALWLGHTDIPTTDVSLRADPTEKLAAMDAMGPPTLKRGPCRVPDKLIALLHGE